MYFRGEMRWQLTGDGGRIAPEARDKNAEFGFNFKKVDGMPTGRRLAYTFHERRAAKRKTL